MNFRHYVYGLLTSGDFEFITTELSEDGAVDFAGRHKEAFPGRYVYYSIMKMNHTDNGPEAIEVCRV